MKTDVFSWMVKGGVLMVVSWQIANNSVPVLRAWPEFLIWELIYFGVNMTLYILTKKFFPAFWKSEVDEPCTQK